jgi:hypothetical protein
MLLGMDAHFLFLTIQKESRGLRMIPTLIRYPFHLRPLRIQLSQYIQIAVTMASELGLARDTHGQEGQDAALACHNLSSL